MILSFDSRHPWEPSRNRLNLEEQRLLLQSLQLLRWSVNSRKIHCCVHKTRYWYFSEPVESKPHPPALLVYDHLACVNKRLSLQVLNMIFRLHVGHCLSKDQSPSLIGCPQLTSTFSGRGRAMTVARVSKKIIFAVFNWFPSFAYGFKAHLARKQPTSKNISVKRRINWHANCLMIMNCPASPPSILALTTLSVSDIFKLERSTPRVMNLNDCGELLVFIVRFLTGYSRLIPEIT